MGKFRLCGGAKLQKVQHNSEKIDILYKNVLESLVYTIMCKYKDPPADVPYMIRTQHTKHQKVHHNSAKHDILYKNVLESLVYTILWTWLHAIPIIQLCNKLSCFTFISSILFKF